MLNQIKTVLLLGALTGLLLVIGAFLGGETGIIIAFSFAVLMNVVTYWFSDKIVLKLYRAKPIEGKHFVKDIVEDVAEKANIPTPRIYITPMKTPNAFATGRNPKHAVVAVTEGLLKLLDKKEIKGVLAHEIAHIKNRDMLISTIAAVLAGAISMIAFIARWGALFGGVGDRDNIVGLLVLAILTPFIALIIRLAISRSREYLADATAAKTIKESEGLQSALKKIHAAAIHFPLRGNGVTSHLFIINPFRAHAFLKLFSTHPPVEERIKRLQNLKF